MIRKRIYTPLIFLSLLFLILLLNTTPVYAGETNIDGENTGSATINNIIAGWNDMRSGYRMYVINDSNTAKSPVLDVWFTDDLLGEENGVLSTETVGVTRAGENIASPWAGRLAQNILNGDMPRPWSGGASNAGLIDSWLLTVDDGNDACNAEMAIRQVFGDNVLDEFYENVEYDPYYLCIEPLANFGIYRPESTKGNYYFTNKAFKGTFYDWCIYLRVQKWATGGIPLKSRSNGTFALAVHLEPKEWTIDRRETLAIPTKLEGIIEQGEGLSAGYGIAMYRISDVTMNGVIDTYDENLGNTPGKSPEPKTKGQEGIFSIVKIYAVDHKDGSDLEYEGCYTRTKVCKNINISDEPEYSVREWTTSKRNVKTDLPFGTTWPQVKDPYVQKGSSSGTVSLDPDIPKSERTLFVLLVREEKEDVEKDLILHESEISRYYELRDVKEFKGIDRRIQWTMNQISLGPCTYSPIHSDHGSYTDSEGNSHTIPCNCICNNRQVVITESHLTFVNGR